MERGQTDRLVAQRKLILALLLVLAAIAWALLAWWNGGTGVGMAMASPTMGMQALTFLAIWVVMMVAMMFPTAAPMILMFHKVQAGKRLRGDGFAATWVFVVGYMLIWTLSGVAAYAGARAAEMIAARAAVSSTSAARVGGAIIVGAGLYQLTPLKDVCLLKCRTPISFIVTSWRDGMTGALRMGLLHGGYCLGCCWLLFLILFPLGMMNLVAMAAITVTVLAEKSMRHGRPVARVAGAALVTYGAVVLAAPQFLPTFVTSGAMVMTAPADMQAMPTSDTTAVSAEPRKGE